MKLGFSVPYTSCPVCSGEDLKKSFDLEAHGTRIHWDVCCGCGLTFQNPRLSLQSIREIYSSGAYWGYGDTAEMAYQRYEQFEPLRIRQCHSRAQRILSAVGDRRGALLDVGCATGCFGNIARQYGFQVTGVEPSERMARFGREQYGLAIHQMTLEETDLEPNYYDVATLWGTDSHFLHPREGFAKLAACLKADGVLLMNYQVFDHWVRRIFPGIKRSWNAIFMLTEASLRHLLRDVGFEILHHSTEWHTTSVSHVLRCCLRRTVPMYLGYMSVRVPAISYPVVVARKIETRVAKAA